MTPYLEPTQEAGRALFMRAIDGPVVMLNLLRFRKVADYSAAPHLLPAAPISGAEAFDRYIIHTMPYLTRSGGELLFLGDGGAFLIGPPEERWDKAMLVRQANLKSFMAFASDTEYLAGLGHRTAALEDSRLPAAGRGAGAGLTPAGDCRHRSGPCASTCSISSCRKTGSRSARRSRATPRGS